MRDGRDQHESYLKVSLCHVTSEHQQDVQGRKRRVVSVDIPHYLVVQGMVLPKPAGQPAHHAEQRVRLLRSQGVPNED